MSRQPCIIAFGYFKHLFQSILTGKEKLGIEEYSFSQSTLEQVFLEFAREQDADLKDDNQTPAA